MLNGYKKLERRKNNEKRIWTNNKTKRDSQRIK
jgi:hypothetical protein